MRRSALVLGLGLLGVAGCRDVPALFEARDRTPPTEPAPLRLTYSPLDDRLPSWSSGGDTVFYTAEGYGSLPRTAGVLLAVPADGAGTAELILPHAHGAGGVPRRLTAAAMAPAGGAVAYVEVEPLWPEAACEGVPMMDGPEGLQPVDPTSIPMPRLRRAVVRVRELGAVGSPAADPALAVPVEGRSYVRRANDWGQAGVLETTLHPFQEIYTDETALPFGPSWSPDGRALAFSDGRRIHTWEVGEAAATALPGTTDGVTPAWDPLGQWIAYTRIPVLETRLAEYVYLANGRITCVVEYTDHRLGSPRLMLVPPGGGSQLALTRGTDPAWSPDGATVYFTADGAIWRVPRDGGTAARVAGTDGGREPAVSPDGRLLAFAKLTSSGSHDVWIVSLEP